ncbi:very short patch repair endonuclease [Mucilaginibacter sp. 3215]|uniref:very short patch repair endonuclease n=1 Tax=Mucilaginibacter sp. 3215 TaxID=3373912 RepID=UPI003D1A07F2
MKQYSRDKRSPVPVSGTASKVMSSIKGKNTKPELLFRKALWRSGLKGYRLHWKVEGRPDIAFPGRKLAIFIHGCYWHRCPICNLSKPKANSTFWSDKFEKNVERDGRKTSALERDGWTVMTFWECEIKKDISPLVRQVSALVNKC